jgi:carbamoylphosphate synthase small subunit
LAGLWASAQVLGIAGVDTRAITRRLRVDGCLNGVICTDESVPGQQGAPGGRRRWSVVVKAALRADNWPVLCW